jgi:hypothetical protein
MRSTQPSAGWRRRTSQLVLAAILSGGLIAITCAPASAFDLVDPAHIAANPANEPTAAADTSGRSDATVDSFKDDAEQADQEFHDKAGDGDSGGGSSPNSSQIPRDEDWCRRWAFNTEADDVALYAPNIDVFDDLYQLLDQCLAEVYPNDPNVNWVAEYLAIQNETSLLAIVEPGGNALLKLEAGVTLPVQTWVAWFRASALAVP